MCSTAQRGTTFSTATPARTASKPRMATTRSPEAPAGTQSPAGSATTGSPAARPGPQAAQTRATASTAGTGADVVAGGPGADALIGGAGDDRVIMGPGPDRADAGADDDRVVAGDRVAGAIACGAGEDAVAPDARDRVHIDCETIERSVSCPARWRRVLQGHRHRLDRWPATRRARPRQAQCGSRCQALASCAAVLASTNDRPPRAACRRATRRVVSRRYAPPRPRIDSVLASRHAAGATLTRRQATPGPA